MQICKNISLCLWVAFVLAACGPRNGAPRRANGSAPHNGAAPTDSEPAAVGTPPPCAPDLRPSVSVQVSAQQGPNGAAAPLAFDNNLYNMNIDDQVRGDYVPGPDPKFVAYLKALRPALLRWPAGYYGQRYQWQESGDGNTLMTPALVDAFMNLSKAVGAQPYLALNLDTGTTDNAAAFVNYVNVEKQYGVKWWEIGNEPDVSGWDSAHNPAAYANNYLSFAQTVHDLDPSIKLVGAELMTGTDILAAGGNRDWMTPILQGAGSKMDAVAWHYYPLDSSQTQDSSSAKSTPAHLLQETAPDWPPAGMDFASSVMPALSQMRDRYAPNAQLWIDEFAEDSGKLNGGGVSDRMVGALWAADALGRYAENGANALFKFIFKGAEEHLYTLVDTQNNPRPEYYTYWLYAQHFGDHLVATQSDHMDMVAAHAALRGSDGSLRVLLVNKTQQEQVTHLSLTDFAPRRAAAYVLQGTAYDATAATVNGQTLTQDNVVLGQSAIAPQSAAACANNAFKLPPYSVTLLIYHP